MLLEGLITNSPGIKMGQKNGQKVLKNAKKSQNTFHLISTVSMLLSEVEPWTVKSWCGQKVLPDLAKSCQRVLPENMLIPNVPIFIQNGPEQIINAW